MIFSAAAAMTLLGSAPLVAAPIQEKTIAYEVDGVKMQGFLARPANRALVPGVVVVHDWDGPNDYEFSRVRQIAQEMGYAAFALDIYGIENQPKTMADNAKMAGAMYGDRALFRKRLAAGADILRKQGGIRGDAIVVMGYCFGGAGALELARSGYPLKGAVSFHGSLDTPMKAAKGDIKAPVVVFHASQDPVVPQAQLNGFLEEMNQAGVDFQVVVYNIKGHAFTNPKSSDYSASGDKRSWSAFGAFLKTVF